MVASNADAIYMGKVGRMDLIELEKMVSAIERHTPENGICRTAYPDLILARLTKPSEPNVLVVDPSICLVVQGVKEVYLAGEVYRYDRGNSLLISVDLPISARVVEASPEKPCLAVRLSLNPSVVGELIAERPDARPIGPSGRGIEVGPIETSLLDALGRLVSLLDSPPSIGTLAPLIVREITYRLLIGPHGARLRQIATLGAPSRHIAKAIGWIRDHFAEPLRGEALARQAQMSLSGFHQHFKTVTGLSPLQYQKQLRLHEARRLMVSEGCDAATAAFRVGYESPSQFSREYRRLFGESPRRDVVSLKSEVQSVEELQTQFAST